MKKLLRSSLVLASASVIFIVINASSNGRGSEDRTGAPGSSGTCSSCHGGSSNLNGQLTLELIDPSTSKPVTQYIPGQKYMVSVKASGTSTKMGFQSTILNAANKNIGSISSPSAGAAVYTSGRNIAGHTAGSSTGTWTYDWTAPASDEGDATIYGVSVISNKNNSDNGDQVVTNKITISPSSSANLQRLSNVNIRIYPNPSVGYVYFSEMVESVWVFNIKGMAVMAECNVEKLSLDHLNNGIYFIKVQHNNAVKTERLLLKK